MNPSIGRPLGAGFVGALGYDAHVLRNPRVRLEHRRLEETTNRLIYGVLAFVAEHRGIPGIYMMNADGSAPTQLTVTGADNVNPAWSPDGQRIAFCRIYPQQNMRSEMWLMNADGSGQHWIGLLGFAPRWSPDGTRFVYQTTLTGAPDIYTCAIDGTDAQPLFASPMGDGNPDWSPDGTRIAFLRTVDDIPQVAVIAADGGEAAVVAGLDHRHHVEAGTDFDSGRHERRTLPLLPRQAR